MTKQQAVKRALMATYVAPTRFFPKPTVTRSPAKPLAIAEEDVRIRAYELWENAGRPHGQDQQLWLQAEKELREGAP